MRFVSCSPALSCCWRDFRQNAEKILHVMTDLVRDHVGLREFAGAAADGAAAELRFDLPEERGIEVNAPVVRTIERPHRRLCRAASRPRDAREQDQFGWIVGALQALEYLAPTVLRVAEHGGDELSALVLRCIGRGLAAGCAG